MEVERPRRFKSLCSVKSKPHHRFSFANLHHVVFRLRFLTKRRFQFLMFLYHQYDDRRDTAVSVCGEEGTDSGRKTGVQPASVKQEVSFVAVEAGMSESDGTVYDRW
jgi:hypothetical protein